MITAGAAVVSGLVAVAAWVVAWRSLRIAQASAEASRSSAEAARQANRIGLYERRWEVAKAVGEFIAAHLSLEIDDKLPEVLRRFNLAIRELDYLFGTDQGPARLVEEVEMTAYRYREARTKGAHEKLSELALDLHELSKKTPEVFKPYLKMAETKGEGDNRGDRNEKAP